MMKIGILTSSRADFGIYVPLLKQLYSDPYFNPDIIAFGTHTSAEFGYTINEIIDMGFPVRYRLNTVPEDDSPQAIARSIGKTINEFSDFWSIQSFNCVLVLGDRYEMFAAVAAGRPFNISFAHIHAGETTMGSIDEGFRHSISLMSEICFTTTEEYRNRTIDLIKDPERVFNVGALSIDNLKNLEFLTIPEIHSRYDIDLSLPTILSTIHPETISFEKNSRYADVLLEALNDLKADYQIVITLPNADTTGLMIREKLLIFARGSDRIFTFESLGMRAYLSFMKYCSFLLGNSSSGFVEASYFPKYAINIGERQKGRIITPNILCVEFNKDKILKTVRNITNMKEPEASNTYGNGNSAERIIQVLKSL